MKSLIMFLSFCEIFRECSRITAARLSIFDETSQKFIRDPLCGIELFHFNRPILMTKKIFIQENKENCTGQINID